MSIQLMMARARMNHRSSSGDSHWSQRLSLLYYEGANGSTSFADEVSGTAWTAGGSAQITTADKKFGSSSLLLNATNSYLLSSFASSIWKFLSDGSTAWTIEAFVNPSANRAQAIFDTGGAATLSVGIYFALNASGNLDVRIARNTSGTYGAQATAGSVPINTWTFVKALYDPAATNGKQLKSFVNGTLVAESVASSLSASNPATTLNIGRFQSGNALYFGGKLDCTRITKGFADYSTAVPTSAFPNHA